VTVVLFRVDERLIHGQVVVAFSGGVDSAFLLKVAADVLGERCHAVTAVSQTMARSEIADASALAAELGVGPRHHVLESHELEVPGFADNPTHRCALCKTELMDVAQPIAAKEAVADSGEQTEEQRRLEKQAREQAKKDAKAAERARVEEARRMEAARKEQEKLAREQAKRDAEAAKQQAKRDAEAAKKQAKLDAENAEASKAKEAAERQAMEAKLAADREAEREQAIEAAAERLRVAEAEYQAELARRSQR